MAETYTIESADDSVPIDPGLLRELRDLLREDEDLDLGVTIKDRPPAPGEQGAIPVALEIVAAATPLTTAFLGVLKHWIVSHKVSVKVRRKDGTSVEVHAGNVEDAARLFALAEGNG
ncbi:MAG: effector-associated constant component EACC1, partial [Streptosporangiaceae bacterium]